MTVLTVIKDHHALIKGDRGRVLPNRRHAAGRERKRKFPQRRILLEPLFGRIAENPFDSG